MSNIVMFDASKLPSYIKLKGKVVNPFAAAFAAGFPVVSIKGKVFHVQRGDERILVHKPDDPTEPATSIEVVIVGYNSNKSKVYYAEGFVEGSAEKPTCYSNDGVAPATDAQKPQAKKCALCPHNQWGSRITESGAKGKACVDHMRLAIVPVGQLNDPMLLRVPASSLRALGQYGDMLAKRGLEPKYVVTKIGFDHSVAYPALVFRPVRFVTETELEVIEDTARFDIINQITGVVSVQDSSHSEPVLEEIPSFIKTKAESKSEHKTELKPQAAPESELEPKSEAKPQAKAKPKVESKSTLAVDEIEAALSEIDFDD